MTCRNASDVVTLVLQIDPSYVGDYLQNTVTITGTPFVNAVEINPANGTNRGGHVYFGVPPQVAINKSAFPALVFAGEPVMYVLTLTNQSSAPLTLQVTDTMPVGFVFANSCPHALTTVGFPVGVGILCCQRVNHGP